MFEAVVMLLAIGQPLQQSDGETVIVTARSLKSTESDLAECLARKCPPREDIELSLAHGENLFVAGDYAESRRVLAKSRERNRRHAETLPVEVGDLNRAYGRIAGFDGHAATARLAQIESLDALKAGLDRNDARVLAQQLMIADEYLKAGRLAAADDVFSTVKKRAIEAGLPQIRVQAMLRQAVAYAAMASVRADFRSAARHLLKQLQDTTDPALAPYREAGTLLEARVAAERGDEKALGAAIATMNLSQQTRPVLIYAPAIDLPPRGERNSTVSVKRGEGKPEWIDVGFDIDPAGKVKNVEILRKTDTVWGYWPDRVLKAISERRYAPVGPNVDRTLLQRTERFSMVYNLEMLNGSRIMSRSPDGQIISLDLTGEPVATNKGGASQTSIPAD